MLVERALLDRQRNPLVGWLVSRTWGSLKADGEE